MELKRCIYTDVSQAAADPPFSGQRGQGLDDSLRALLRQSRLNTCAGNTYAIAEGAFED